MSFSEEHSALCGSGDYLVVDRFDMAMLIWPEGELIIGDHCSCDPTCAVVNVRNGWCLSGGQGLAICLFEDGLPKGREIPDRRRIKELFLWRNENPPPDGRTYWLIAGAWLYDDDVVRVLVDPLGDPAGLYEVDVRTLRWQRL